MDDLNKSHNSHWDFKTPLYMNHGSFGATPRAVLGLKNHLDAEIDRNRDGHFWFDLARPHEEARRAVAAFVNAPAGDVVLLDNATEALSVVLHSLSFAAGDEILISSHGYGPFNDTFTAFSRRHSITISVADISFPINNETQVLDAILEKVTPRTKLAVIDHITSPTALVLPIAKIVKALEAKGVDTYVDGAHGIGHLPLDMRALGAAYYASNNHKWLCAPLQSAFLYVRPDRQAGIVPSVGSLHATLDYPFAERFAWQGTKNISARLCLPETIRYVGALHAEGWPGIYRRNRALVLKARALFCERLNVAPPCPEAMVGCMAAVPLGRFPALDGKPHPFHALMRERFGYGINAPAFDGGYNLRLSAHLYNSMPDFERMADDLMVLLQGLVV